MEISQMSLGIVKMIDKNYSQYIENECLDIIQIKNICYLYEIKSRVNHNIELNEINFSSPIFKKIKTSKNKKNQDTILKSQEFIKKYNYFIRVIYACLKIDIKIFDMNDQSLTLKNNYQLTKSLEQKKKDCLREHIVVLKNQYKNISQPIGEEYDSYYKNYMVKIKIIDKIMNSLSKLIQTDVLAKTDNLLTLILPYFYKYTEYIEEYNATL